jgi:hypothetical protein
MLSTSQLIGLDRILGFDWRIVEQAKCSSVFVTITNTPVFLYKVGGVL